MRRILFLLALCQPVTVHSARPIKRLPLEVFQGKQFTLKAVVGGRVRTFLFDTGEGVTMISPAVAHDVGCEPCGDVTAFRMTGQRLDLPRCDNVVFSLAGKPHTAPTTIVYDLGKVDADAAVLDGAVGLDLFADRVITIRFASREVVIETPQSLAALRRTSVEVPIRLVREPKGGSRREHRGEHAARPCMDGTGFRQCRSHDLRVAANRSVDGTALGYAGNATGDRHHYTPGDIHGTGASFPGHDHGRQYRYATHARSRSDAGPAFRSRLVGCTARLTWRAAEAAFDERTIYLLGGSPQPLSNPHSTRGLRQTKCTGW